MYAKPLLCAGTMYRYINNLSTSHSSCHYKKDKYVFNELENSPRNVKMIKNMGKAKRMQRLADDMRAGQLRVSHLETQAGQKIAPDFMQISLLCSVNLKYQFK